jgi:hypothetical protein
MHDIRDSPNKGKGLSRSSLGASFPLALMIEVFNYLHIQLHDFLQLCANNV